jgi:hypothetical protein
VRDLLVIALGRLVKPVFQDFLLLGQLSVVLLGRAKPGDRLPLVMYPALIGVDLLIQLRAFLLLRLYFLLKPFGYINVGLWNA